MSEKSKTAYRCRACGRVWRAEEVGVNPRRTALVYVCADPFCGGTCDPVKQEPETERS